MNTSKMVRVCTLSAVVLFCNRAIAQAVAERDEPHHKIVFENEYVRLVDGRVRDHDTTLAHLHDANSVVVFLSNSTLGIQLMGEKPAVTEVRPGDIVYRAYGDKPITHIVWNQSMPVLHFLVVELVKQHRDDDTCALLTQSGIAFQWQQPLVRAYSMDLAKDRKYSLPPSNCAYLLIDVSGTVNVLSPGRARRLQADDFAFFPPHGGIEINGGAEISGGKEESTHCVLLELNAGRD